MATTDLARSRRRITLAQAIERASLAHLKFDVLRTPKGLARTLRLEASDRHGLYEVAISKADETLSEVEFDRQMDKCILEQPE